MAAVTSIHIWEPSDHPRSNWPVTVSVPFAKGAVREPRQVIVRDPLGNQIPAQRRVLATWPDESVKWLLLDFPIDLEARQHVDVGIEIATDPVAVDAQEGLRVEWAGDALRIDTGPMQLDLSSDKGGLPQRLEAYGKVCSAKPGGVVVRQPDGRILSIENGPATVDIEEHGPQRAVIAIRGRHADDDGEECLDYTLRLVVYARQPIARWYYTIVNREEAETTPVSGVQLIQPMDFAADDMWAMVGTDRERYRMPESWVSMTTDGLETRATDGHRKSGNLNTIRAEVQMEPFLVVGDTDRTAFMLPRWCHFLHPKAAHFYGKALRYDVWPDSGDEWQFRRGMAKTHELTLALFPRADTYEATIAYVAPILRPLVPIVPAEYIESTGALPTFFAARPAAYPALETKLTGTFRDHARAYGMLHYGDAPGAAYTAQGRGRQKDRSESLIWTNGEYDMPYMAMQQFLRSGDRNVWLSSAEPSAWHMMDVDTRHYDPDEPMNEGGQAIHTVNHVGAGSGGVDPSHEWAEGMILHHLLTGLEHSREHALALGEHLLAWTDTHEARLSADTTSARVSGWALLALTALYEFTRDERYRACAIRHGEGLQARIDGETGHLTETTSYGFPYRAGFMTDLAVMGLKRLEDITGDDKWKSLAMYMVDDQLEHLSLPSGVLVYKELPENRYPYLGMFTLEVMTYAWQWTGKKRYLEHGVRMLQLAGPFTRTPNHEAVFLLESAEGALYQEVRASKRDSHSLLWFRFAIPFLRLLHELDLLKQYEPPPFDLSAIEADADG